MNVNNLLWLIGIFAALACVLYAWICIYRENKEEERFEKWNSSLDNFEHLLDIYKHMINPKRTPPYNFDTDGKTLLDKCQNEQNQKNLLSGNIDDLPKEIQIKYYADLGKKLTKQ